MEQLLGPGVGHPELHPHLNKTLRISIKWLYLDLSSDVREREGNPHRLNGLVEDLLHAGDAEALVRKVLGVVVIVELACPALVVKVVEAEVAFVFVYRYLVFVLLSLLVFVFGIYKTCNSLGSHRYRPHRSRPRPSRRPAGRRCSRLRDG